MKNLGKLLLLVALFATSLFSAYNPLDGVKAQKEEALKYVNKFITVKDFKAWKKEKKDFKLVDVRERSEIFAGQIPYKKTLHIPRGMLYGAVKKGKMKPNETYVIVCRSGHRALLSAATLVKFYNFKNVYVLKGGIKAWIKSGEVVSNGLHLGDVKIELTK